jgi:hypothetical protein
MLLGRAPAKRTDLVSLKRQLRDLERQVAALE